MKLIKYKDCLKVVGIYFVCLSLVGCGKEWVPTGGWQGIVSSSCEAAYLEQKLANPRLSSKAQVELVQEYLSRCDKDLGRHSKGALSELIELAGLRYDYMKIRSAEPMAHVGSDGLKIRMSVFMKPGFEKRPLVLVKCGVQCDQSSATLSHMLINLFDEGPFHVVLLPSITSASFQSDNKIMPVGGYDEGRQLVRLARWIQSDKFKYQNRVSEVHIVGVSLGGHSALYAGLYASYMRLDNGRPVIKSVFTGCPAVDLEGSVKSLFYKGGIVGILYKRLFWDQLNSLARVVPIIGDLVETREEQKLKDIPEIISRGALDYYQRATLDGDFNEAPFKGTVIRDREDLWRLNRFQDYAHLVRVPVYTWSAENDRVVSSAENSDLLARAGLRNYNFISTPRGSHCAFSDAYTWRSAGAIIRGILLSQSEGLNDIRSHRVETLNILATRDVDKEDWFDTDNDRKRRGLQWRAKSNTKTVELIAYGRRRCLDRPDFSRCKSGYSISEVHYKNVGLTLNDVPRNDIEAQALTRWLNAKVWVWGAKRGIIDATERPQLVEWERYGSERIF